MRRNGFVMLFLALLLSTGLFANDKLSKKTYIYSIKGKDTLRLDKYDDPAIKKIKPCIVFLFGGGFSTGTRDNKDYLDYFSFLSNKGIDVVSIDYRLGMKNLSSSDPMAMGAQLYKSVSMAVEDLFDATFYILNHADSWKIDKNKIIANGSSAGAVSVLTAEYAICNRAESAKKLPADFNYAGVISFAGAVFASGKDLTFSRKPTPMLLFHGNSDSNVPYGKISMMNFGLYGSQYIAEKLRTDSVPYYFFDADNATHEMAAVPMTKYRWTIYGFIDQYIENKMPLMIHSVVSEIGKAEAKKDFTIEDYILKNYKK